MSVEINGNTSLQKQTTFGAHPGYFGGTIDTSLVIGNGFNLQVFSTCIQPDNKIISVGTFTSYSSITSNRLIRLNSDGTKDNSFVIGSGFNTTTTTVRLQNDGKILVGGLFTSYSGISVNRLLRLNSNGSFDSTFVTGSGPDTTVLSSCILSDGKIIIGGDFASYSGFNSNRLIKLNSNGSVDSSFSIGTGFNASIFKIIEQPDNKILVGGAFTQFSGTTTRGLIRLNSNGTVDSTFFRPSAGSTTIYSIVLQPDSKIIVGGSFTSYSGVSKNRIVRLNSDGNIDNTFNIGSGFDSTVTEIILQQDGKIICVGSFTSYNGITSIRIIRLNSDGTLDTTFQSRAGLDSGNVFGDGKIAIDSNGKILVGTSFTSYDSQSYNRLVRINSEPTIT